MTSYAPKNNFVVGSRDDWQNFHRKRALRQLRSSLDLSVEVESRLTPADVQKLAHITGRSGKRVKTPSPADPYWQTLLQKAQLAIPAGATHFFTKHFDQEYGQYYYYDHVSGASTWDKPVGDNIQVHRPESLVNQMFESHYSSAVEKRKLVERRRVAYDVIQKDKAEQLAVEWMQQEKADAKKLANLWRNACVEAAEYGGRFELSWRKLGVVDPVMYNFEANYGMPLKAMKLVGLGLTELSEEVPQRMNTLEVLSLACNQLTALPDNFVMLTKLKKLNLLKNKLTELPARIGALSHTLTTLDVANNQLTRLPLTFAALRLMTVVNLECNKLTVLPENLDQMAACKYLNLNNNCLVRLPRCIARMPNLVTLSACKNKISYIPQELTESTSLRAIRLTANLIRYIPETIGNMKRLRELCVDHNLLSLLPLSMHKMRRLRVLRIDGNVHLTDPPADVIAKGAEGVVEYFYQRVMSDEKYMVRLIVTAVQDILCQAHERGITEESEFQANTKPPDDPDDWYAFQMPYLWSHILPALNDIWKVEGLTGVVEKRYKLAAFPYSEKEVHWALGRFADVNGPVMRYGQAMFRKCSCADAEGRRMPCVPPKVGWMCYRTCALVKSKNVMQADRQNRQWQAYSQSNLSDAVLRAKNEAFDYLKSGPGKDWLAALAYERAQELIGDREESTALRWRQRLANTRKKRVIRRYDRVKRRVNKEREKRVKAMEDEKAELQTKLTDLPDGFMKTHTEARIELIENRLKDLEEDVQLQRLQLMCEQECDTIDDDVYEQRLKTAADYEKDPLASSSSESDSDSDASGSSSSTSTDLGGEKDPREARKQERLQQRAAAREASAQAIARAAARVRTHYKVGAPDGTLIEPPAKTLYEALRRGAKKTMEQEHLKAAMEATQKVMEEAAEKMKVDDDDSSNASAPPPPPPPKPAAVPKKRGLIRRAWRRTKDLVEIRSRRMYTDFTGDNVELIRQLTYEYYWAYVNIMVGLAKEKAMHDLELIESMRKSLGSAGLQVVFETWRDFVKTKRQRERRDQEIQYEQELKAFATAMESVKLAEFHVSLWTKRVDVYTEQVFWENEQTKETALERPGLHNYLPQGFSIPPMPESLPPWKQDTNVSDDGDNAAAGVAGGGAAADAPAERTTAPSGNQEPDEAAAPAAPAVPETDTAAAADDANGNAGGRVRFGLLDMDPTTHDFLLATQGHYAPDRSLSFQLVDDSYSSDSIYSDDDVFDDGDDDEFGDLGAQQVEEEGSDTVSNALTAHASAFSAADGTVSFSSVRKIMASSVRHDESGLGFLLPIGFQPQNAAVAAITALNAGEEDTHAAVATAAAAAANKPRVLSGKRSSKVGFNLDDTPAAAPGGLTVQTAAGRPMSGRPSSGRPSSGTRTPNTGGSGNAQDVSPLSDTFSPRPYSAAQSPLRGHSAGRARSMRRGSSARRRSASRSGRSDKGDTEEAKVVRARAEAASVTGAMSQVLYGAMKAVVPANATDPVLLAEAAEAVAAATTATAADAFAAPFAATNAAAAAAATASGAPGTAPDAAALAKPLRGVRGRIARALMSDVDLSGGEFPKAAPPPRLPRERERRLSEDLAPGSSFPLTAAPAARAATVSSTAFRAGVASVPAGAGAGIVAARGTPQATSRPASGHGAVVASKHVPAGTQGPLVARADTSAAVHHDPSRPRQLSTITPGELKDMHREAEAFWGVEGTEEDRMAVYQSQNELYAQNFKREATVEVYIAAKRVRQARARPERQQTRRETYIKRPDETTVQSALGQVELAHRRAEAERLYFEGVAAKQLAEERQRNRFGYDLTNVTRAPNQDALPTEHLLVLAAESIGNKENRAVDTRPIVESSQERLALRTKLAREALKINEEVVQLAAKKGIVPRPKLPTLYEKEFKMLVDEKWMVDPEDRSSSDEEGQPKPDKKARLRKERQREKELKELREKKKAEDAVVKEKLDLAIYKRLRGDEL